MKKFYFLILLVLLSLITSCKTSVTTTTTTEVTSVTTVETTLSTEVTTINIVKTMPTVEVKNIDLNGDKTTIDVIVNDPDLAIKEIKVRLMNSNRIIDERTIYKTHIGLNLHNIYLGCWSIKINTTYNLNNGEGEQMNEFEEFIYCACV